MGKITFREIAQKAEVSQSAVSIVLNGQKGVGPDTRRKILEAAEKLGYTRAPIPRPEQTGCVRLVIYQKHGLVVDKTPFFNAMLDGIGQSCKNLGAPLQIHYVLETDGNEAMVQSQLKIDNQLGIILLATEMTRQDVERWIAAIPRLVVLDSYFGVLKVDTVAIDNEEGTYEAVNSLVRKGYTDIGYLHSSIWINNFDERKTGFYRCLADAELAPGAAILLESTIEGAKRDMEAYLDGGGKVSKAYFADNDIIAVGAMQALKAKDWQIPEDTVVVGFDDMPYSALSDPPISTCRVYKHKLGQAAVYRLMELRRNKSEVHMKIRIATKFIPR
jgi:DNA-binding LacI/PurR family transcriptional regulator